MVLPFPFWRLEPVPSPAELAARLQPAPVPQASERQSWQQAAWMRRPAVQSGATLPVAVLSAAVLAAAAGPRLRGQDRKPDARPAPAQEAWRQPLAPKPAPASRQPQRVSAPGYGPRPCPPQRRQPAGPRRRSSAASSRRSSRAVSWLASWQQIAARFGQEWGDREQPGPAQHHRHRPPIALWQRGAASVSAAACRQDRSSRPG